MTISPQKAAANLHLLCAALCFALLFITFTVLAGAPNGLLIIPTAIIVIVIVFMGVLAEKIR